MRAMEYVVAVFERLPAPEQHELIYHLRDMLTEMERDLKRKQQSLDSHQLPGLAQ